MNMEQPDKTIEALRRSLMVPVFYNEDYEICERVLSICFEEGIELFEFTNRGAKAVENFEKMQELVQRNYPGKYLGIGTIKTVTEAVTFIKFKPDFIVSPIVNLEVGTICEQNDIPWMPGCITPTEIHFALTNGATVVKIFPASLVGPSFIKAVKAVFPGVHLMPTGGIKADKSILKEWFDAGVLCVGMGSELLERELIQHKKWDLLRDKIRKARQLIISCIAD
jgi:2-dehydro-3-deoxyphosphogluconate aldolase/(4S)-4-hydroxy-2-oxoglutarate aldolase